MNGSTKQKQTHRHKKLICDGKSVGNGNGGGRIMQEEVCGQEMKIMIYRMDKQGLTVHHKELYCISCDKP